MRSHVLGASVAALKLQTSRHGARMALKAVARDSSQTQAVTQPEGEIRADWWRKPKLP